MEGFDTVDEGEATTRNKEAGSRSVLSRLVFKEVISMLPHLSRSSGRSTFLWLVVSLVVVLSLALAACGGGTSPASTTQSDSSQSTSQPAASSATVTITEKAGAHDIYGFAPQTLTIKAGQTVIFNNQSDEFHLLLTADAAGHPTTDAAPFTAKTIVPTSRASATTTLSVVFSTAGTYYYTSKLVNRIKDNDHPEGAWSQGWGTIVVTA
jgi:plastocyanin